MRAILLTAMFAAAVAATSPAVAQDVTASCRDGTTFAGTSRRGACSGHGGVQAYGAAAPAAPATTQTPVSIPPPNAAPAPRPAGQVQAAPAVGGPGQVWVNTKSKVYHCQGDRYYGKTRQGAYMTEGEAKAAGDRPDHGKACS